eukprot:TRINITY_DN3284_c0_g3_i1.p1 TRINITY_DN3284_c0_g3~~TRINITY_DN3284_c0_g3_i1.p1  ORF type:complete len:104 (+),score=30.28 TRINITY_DN3284_c0_g3_i1:196-507(+)
MAADRPIHRAAEAGDVKKLEKILSEDPTLVNIKGYDDLTPLHWAAISGNVEAVKLLLDRGANIDAKSLSGETPLSEASFLGHLDITSTLLWWRNIANKKTNRS